MKILSSKDITELPFFYGSHDSGDNGGEPQVLPFSLFYDHEYGLFRQKSSEELDILLKRVYEKGSLVDGSISSESGSIYIEKLVAFISSYLELNRSFRVLEIGSGSGVILKNLSERYSNLELFGIDPGDHQLVSNLDGINIVKDFFPSLKVTGKFDLIFTFCVLEHIEDIDFFIAKIREQTKDGGKIIIGVPDCEPFLEHGDLSIFIHEHFNYFSSESLSFILNSNGFTVESSIILEGMIVLAARKSDIKPAIGFQPKISEVNFFSNVQKYLKGMENLFSSFEQEDIAVYVPGRALNILFILNKLNVRLVDDNREIHGRYLPCLTRPIESFDELVVKPPKLLFIYSRTFGERIKLKCEKIPELKSNTTFLTINDLF